MIQLTTHTRMLREDISDIFDYNFFDLVEKPTNSTRLYMLLLYTLIRSQGLKQIVELGGFQGNTTAFLLRALEQNKDGGLWVYESDVNCAMHLLKRFDGHQRLHVLNKRTQDATVPPIADLVFVDGDHTYHGIQADWEIWNSRLKLGGYLVFHDTDNLEVLQFLNETFPHPQYEHLLLPEDHGLLLARKVK